jgi:arginine decarboxylase
MTAISHTTSVNGNLPIMKASGAGGTALSAFHNALVKMNLSHYNLVRLSSVVPPGTWVDSTGQAPAPSGAWGDRLYCVYAEQRTTTPGDEAWAGIGWVQRVSGDGGGLMVEHEGRSEAFVTDLILTSLEDMVQESAEEFSAPQFVVNGVHCTNQPVCSLVIAPFEIVPWQIGAPARAASTNLFSGSRQRKRLALARALSLIRS